MQALYFIAFTFYLSCFFFLVKSLGKQEAGIGWRIAVPWLVAMLAHGGVLWMGMMIHGQINLPFFRAASLMAFIVSTITLATSLYRNLVVIGVVIVPLTTFLLVLDWLDTGTTNLVTAPDAGIRFHILSSLLAYSVLSFSGILAIFLYFQNRQLKSNHSSSLLPLLPPLDAMEALLFNLVWVGVLLLTAGLLSGWLYHEDLFAQHLVHKTTLSVSAWLVFVLLLLGRSCFGWRGERAVHFTLAGMSLLIFAYFGSKFVLEFLLVSANIGSVSHVL